jgi:hypothetical protein
LIDPADGTLALLLGPDGQRALDDAAGLPPKGLDDLAARSPAAAFRRTYPPELAAAALTMTQLRRSAATKFTRADAMWFTRAGLEQATSEVIAVRRADRINSTLRLSRSDPVVADLCCGVGGDLVQLARLLRTVAVDRDPTHLAMAGLNAAVYASTTVPEFLDADVTSMALDRVDAVFIDPARRRASRRLPTGASDPPLDWCVGMAGDTSAGGGPAVVIKCAPGLDRGTVPAGWEMECVSLNGAMKEVTLWSPPFAIAPRRATVLLHGNGSSSGPPQAAELVGEGTPTERSAAPVGDYVFDPDPAVTRAGLVGLLAADLGCWPLDTRGAMLSGPGPHRTPFARTLRVLQAVPARERLIRAALSELDIGAVDIRRRGSGPDIEELRRSWRLEGNRRAHVLLVPVVGTTTAIIAEPVDGY